MKLIIPKIGLDWYDKYPEYTLAERKRKKARDGEISWTV